MRNSITNEKFLAIINRAFNKKRTPANLEVQNLSNGKFDKFPQKRNDRKKSTTPLPINVVESFSDLASPALLINNVDSPIFQVNQHFLELSGYQRSDIEGRLAVSALFPAEKLGNLQTKEAVRNFYFKLLTKDGSFRPVVFQQEQIPGNHLQIITLKEITDEQLTLEKMNAQNKFLAGIHFIIEKVSSHKTIEELFGTVLREMIPLCQAEGGGICLVDDRKRTFTLKCQKNLKVDQKTLQNFEKKDFSHWWAAIQSHQIFFIFQDAQPHPFASPEAQSVLYIPLWTTVQAYGVLAIMNPAKSELLLNLKDLLEILGIHLGQKIELFKLRQNHELQAKENEEKNQELKSFIYTVSHDLKSPLVALYGFADLLKDNYWGKLDDEGQDYLNRIMNNAELMHRMIDALLELSRIGRTLGPRTKFSTHRLVVELTSIFSYQINQKKIQLHYSKKMPIIYADRERIATVFQNLLTNAIKFCPDDGSAVIEVDWREEAEQFLFWIKDNGSGIETAHLPWIFDLFQKFGGQQNSGTGVGLTLAKKIVEHHGGKIWVESQKNAGATFYFTIPKFSKIN